jgi:hypothetical protein
MTSRKNKKSKPQLDFDFEATVVDDDFTFDTFNQNNGQIIQPVLVEGPKREEPIVVELTPAEKEAERRRKLRARQRQLQEEGIEPGVVSVLSSTSELIGIVNRQNNINTNNNVVNQLNESSGLNQSQTLIGGSNSNPGGNTAAVMQQTSATVFHPSHNVVKMQDNKAINDGNSSNDDGDDDDEDDESDDDGPKLVFISKSKIEKDKKAQKVKQSIQKSNNLHENFDTISMLANSAVQDVLEQAMHVNHTKDKSTTINRYGQIIEIVTHDGVELPDDTDYIEDIQIDVSLWRKREAERLFKDLEEAMKQMLISDD